MSHPFPLKSSQLYIWNSLWSCDKLKLLTLFSYYNAWAMSSCVFGTNNLEDKWILCATSCSPVTFLVNIKREILINPVTFLVKFKREILINLYIIEFCKHCQPVNSGLLIDFTSPVRFSSFYRVRIHFKLMSLFRVGTKNATRSAP